MLPSFTFQATPYHNHATGDFAGYWLHNKFGGFGRLDFDDNMYFVAMERMTYGMVAGEVHCVTPDPYLFSAITEFLASDTTKGVAMTLDQFSALNLPLSFMCHGEIHRRCRGKYLTADYTWAACTCKCHVVDDNFDVWIEEEEAKFYNVEVCAHRHCGWATTLAGEDYWVCEDCGGEM